jgi:hypothetical protein
MMRVYAGGRVHLARIFFSQLQGIATALFAPAGNNQAIDTRIGSAPNHIFPINVKSVVSQVCTNID